MFIEIDTGGDNELIHAYNKRDYVKFCNLIESGSNINCVCSDPTSIDFGYSLINIMIWSGGDNETDLLFFNKLLESGVWLGKLSNNHLPLARLFITLLPLMLIL